MKLTLLLILCSLTSACGRRKEKEDNLDSIYKKQQEALELYHHRPLDITQTEDVHFTRKRQMTNRFNCKKQKVSHKMETINSLSKLMKLSETPKAAWRYDVYNRTNKDGAQYLQFAGTFTIDYSPTTFNMQVEKGENQIEYVFYRCSNIVANAEGRAVCAVSEEVLKEGILQINVTYETKELDGERDVHPNILECAFQI